MRPCESLNVFFDPEFHVDVCIQLQRVVDSGFRCLDMNFWDWSHDPRSPFMQDDWQRWVERIAEAAQRAGAVFTQAHAHVHNFYDEKDQIIHERQIERSIIGAGMLGVPWIVMHPSQRPDWAEAGSSEKMISENVRYFRSYTELASKWRTGLALENMKRPSGGLTTAQQLCELIDRIDRPNVGACWDTGHAHLVGQDQPAAIRTLGRRLHALHVADNLGEKDDHTMPFVGSIDWFPLVRALNEIGYDGDFTFESHNFIHNMPEACRAEALRLMYRVGVTLSGNL